MAAPKKWGYTREQAFGPEIVVERLLSSAGERRDVAAWARAAADSSEFDGKDWIADPREGLLEQCRLVGQS